MERYRTKTTSLSLKEYIKLSKIDMYVNYSKFLKKWKTKYPKELIKILIFEDLINNKKETMISLAKFLNINDTFYNILLLVLNVSV